MPRWHIRGGNPDTVQGPLVELARRLGASVAIISKVGHGCPDALVGFRAQTLPPWEFKTPGVIGKRGRRRQGGQLREKQDDFQRTWQGGQVPTISTADDVVRCLLEADARRPDLRPVPAPGGDVIAMARYLVEEKVTPAELAAFLATLPQWRT